MLTCLIGDKSAFVFGSLSWSLICGLEAFFLTGWKASIYYYIITFQTQIIVSL